MKAEVLFPDGRVVQVPMVEIGEGLYEVWVREPVGATFHFPATGEPYDVRIRQRYL